MAAQVSASLCLSDKACEQIAFIGNTLGPVFLLDPKRSPLVQQLLAAFKGLDVPEASRAWPFTSSDSAAYCLREMQQSLCGESLEDIASEYRELFLGPHKLVAPPYGSVYTDRDNVVEGQSTEELREWLRLNGVAESCLAVDAGEQARTIEDHVGRMLLLMAWLAENHPSLLGEFLAEHFLTWVNHYLEALESASGEGFYYWLAKLTEISLQGMEAALQIPVKAMRFTR